MSNAETRNGRNWDASYTYSDADDEDLLKHLFSSGNAIKIKLDEDKDKGVRGRRILSTARDSDKELILAHVSINSPEGALRSN